MNHRSPRCHHADKGLHLPLMKASAGITELPVAFGSLFVHVSYLSERHDLGRGAVKYLLHENHFGAIRFEKG